MVSQDAPRVGRLYQPGRLHSQGNVGEGERLASMAMGGALTLLGLSRRSLGGLALAGLGLGLLWRGTSGHCGIYQRLGIDSSDSEAQPHDYFDRGIHLEESITINKSPEELFRFWRQFENLPRFMNTLKSVEIIDEKRSRWSGSGAGHQSVEWDAEIINEEANHLIAWRTLANADVQHTGSVRFVRAPGARGTQVKVAMEYLLPTGRLGAAVAKLFGSAPDQDIREDLRRFKQLMETGEIATTHGQPRGGRLGRSIDRSGDKSRPAELRAEAGAVKDVVQEASEESFPASDAPGWGSSTG